ncbi:MAG TPA: hypothetical protein DIU07_18845, partial [Rhodobacteraceae bacterium]|nr:hypothetical protein [Paracoccaceae bacterium]
MKYRVHHLLEPDPASVQGAWIASVRFFRETGLLADTMYETGQTKRQALTTPVSLPDSGRTEPELSRTLAREDWEEFVVATSLWADGAPGD